MSIKDKIVRTTTAGALAVGGMFAPGCVTYPSNPERAEYLNNIPTTDQQGMYTRVWQIANSKEVVYDTRKEQMFDAVYYLCMHLNNFVPQGQPGFNAGKADFNANYYNTIDEVYNRLLHEVGGFSSLDAQPGAMPKLVAILTSYMRDPEVRIHEYNMGNNPSITPAKTGDAYADNLIQAMFENKKLPNSKTPDPVVGADTPAGLKDIWPPFSVRGVKNR